jgi:predicted Abi (CAAX) family protease
VFDLLDQCSRHSRIYSMVSRDVRIPQANELGEAALRYALSACESMMPDQAREEIAKIYNEHGVRSSWLWARMGQAPLATALGHLSCTGISQQAIAYGCNTRRIGKQLSANWLASRF